MSSSTTFDGKWITEGDSKAISACMLENALEQVQFHQKQSELHIAQIKRWESIAAAIRNAPAPVVKPIPVVTPPVVEPVVTKPLSIPAPPAATVTPPPPAPESPTPAPTENSVAKRASMFSQMNTAPPPPTTSSVSIKDRMASFQRSTSATSSASSSSYTAPAPVVAPRPQPVHTPSPAVAKPTPAPAPAPVATYKPTPAPAPVVVAASIPGPPADDSPAMVPAYASPSAPLVSDSNAKRYCKALYAFAGDPVNNVYPMTENEMFEILSTDSDWWLSRKLTSTDPEETAFVPRNYVKLCDGPVTAPVVAQPPIPSAAAVAAPPAPPADTRPRVLAVYDYLTVDDNSFLTFRNGEELRVVGDTAGEDWWLVENASGQQGYVPSNYMKLQ